MNKRYRFTIELISDLCASNGESYGSVIDTDVSYDKYGLPVIKGKSLKGCLLEIAEELTDLGQVKENFIDEVFGKAGNDREGKLVICDAHPENYTDCIRDIRSMENSLSINQVISCFSYTRGQTSIDSETGKAKEKSLRTIRVVRRGLKFICEYIIDENLNDGFAKCIKLLRRIGMNRTRGLGEVRCVPDMKPCEDRKKKYSKLNDIKKCHCLRYTVETLSPLIATKENENINYIPGSTIEGLCFRNMDETKMKSYLEKGLRFTNALLSDGEHRFASVPGFIGKQKVPKQSEKGTQLFVFDTASCSDAQPPAMPVKMMNAYISDNFTELISISSDSEINYHHRQSQDNPGIVDGNNFYQISSLSEGLLFAGNIYGSSEMLEDIYNTFGDESDINIGYYRSGGYGKCLLRLFPETYDIKEKKTDHIAVCLVSPAILYDKYGTPSAMPDVFKDYFKDFLCQYGTDINEEKKAGLYLRYTTVGGYNTTWNLNKQRFQAYAAGTCFVYKLKNEVDVSLLSGKCIGERTSEGFGEIKVFDYKDIVNASGDLWIKPFENKYPNEENDCSGPISTLIREKEIKEKLRKNAIEHAQTIKSDNDNSKKFKVNPAQIGRLALMCEKSKNYDDFQDTINSIKDEEKKNNALVFIKDYNSVSEKRIKEKPEYFKVYYRTLLSEAKFLLRKGE